MIRFWPVMKATGYEPYDHDSIPRSSRDFTVHQCVQTGSATDPASYSMSNFISTASFRLHDNAYAQRQFDFA